MRESVGSEEEEEEEVKVSELNSEGPCKRIQDPVETGEEREE